MKMTIEQFFYEHPIFSFDEFCDFKRSNGGSTKGSIYQLLQYYVRTHKIALLRKGLYAVVPPNLITSNESISVDPYLFAASISADSIIAYHTALELHGASYSNFQRFTFLTSKKIKPFDYNGQLFQPVSHTAALKKLHKEGCFVLSENRGGMIVRLTNLARTYVDILNRPDLCGGWEEVCRSISNITAVDIDEIIEYCLMLDSPVLCAKVGFFLEKRSGAFAVNEILLNKLLSKRPKSPYYLVHKSQGSSELVKKWNLMAPRTILKNAWEEPDYDI